MNHCQHCPLAPDQRCPSETQPRLCLHAERESRQKDPRQHYWHDAIRKKAGVFVEPPVPPAIQPATENKPTAAPKKCPCGDRPKVDRSLPKPLQPPEEQAHTK